MRNADSLVCLTGGTGYIGGRLLPLLKSRGAGVRCLTRRPESLQSRLSSETQVVRADVLVMAVFITFINLIVDVSYCYLDPRIRYRTAR